MRLEKTLAYLEGQLRAPSVQADAYYSWVSDRSESLWQRYAWFAYNYGGGPREDLKPLLDALEQTHGVIAEDKRRLIERMEDYDARTYR